MRRTSPYTIGFIKADKRFFAPEPFFGCDVTIQGRPAETGHFLFGGSMETSDFFKDEAKRCRDNAGAAATKADQESWLNMASRWEELLNPGDDGVKAAQNASALAYDL
jgi:hypothetical protein